MTDEKLFRKINLIKFAESRQFLQTQIELSSMERLQEVCGKNCLSGIASLSIEGEVFSKYIKGLNGKVEAFLPLTCQRCMQPFDCEIISNFKLALVFDEKTIEDLPSELEPLILSGPEYDLKCLVEDELLLSIPAMAMHTLADCKVKQDAWVFGTPKEAIKKENPFDQLADLKTKFKGER